MLGIYHSLTAYSAPALRRILRTRLKRGKEDPARMGERMGEPGLPRPPGPLAWFHAASIGEAQSTLILVNTLLERFPDLHVLVTTGTVTSAAVMHQRLPGRAMHQYYPLDHPEWVERFLNHWQPSLIFWMESELWPNMLRAIRLRNIHCVLVNARMSLRSYSRWKKARATVAELLSAFDLCLAQTREDAESFTKLHAINVRIRDNLKYAAAPLPCDGTALDDLKRAIGNRPLWLYASTHDGEEQIACALHKKLKHAIPGLLTVIVPRHPERRDAVNIVCRDAGLNASLRSFDLTLPHDDDDIYIADTLGELGLFYRLAPVCCIGRTFSRDGGGAHNPIEAAQLGSAVLHGPLTQNWSLIFTEMDDARAAIRVDTEDRFAAALQHYLTDAPARAALQDAGRRFAAAKAETLPQILKDIEPFLIDSGIMPEDQKCA